MQYGYFYQHWLDNNQNPAGGVSNGRGFTISWQKGPLGQDKDRVEPNGAFVEDVIAAVITRIEFYQGSRFKCDENQLALNHLQAALFQLNKRTKDREARKAEGTHAV